MSDNREESLYYLKIVFMYIELGTEVVLNTFVHHTPKKDAKLFLDSNQEKLQQLRRKKTLNAEECKLVFSPSPNPEDFDISLLITLSINLFSKEELPPPKEGWSYPPKDGDTSIAADLLRLRTLRNVIVGHKSKARLPKWRFEREWETVSEIFLRIYRAIAPANETQLKERLNAYKQQRLAPCIENRYDAKLKEWHDEISKIQDEVEKSIQKLQDFDKYFKSKSNRYERYIKLLVKGGRLVLSAFLEKKTKSQSESLQETLKRKEDVIRSKINNVNHLRVLYPPDHETTLKAIDTSTWRIPLLANVILHLFGDQLDEPCCDAVRTINAAYENHADVAFAALDSDNFNAYSSDLQHGLKSLQYHLDEQSKTDCKNILEEYKLVQKGDETRTTYFDELKAQGMQIKSIADVHNEMLRKTTEIVEHMVTHGIEFKNDHVVDLKIVPHGTDEEKKLMAENVLTKILQAVQEGSGDICDHPTLKEEVEKFLKDITEWINNKRAHVRQKCIVLSVVCSSPNEILDLLTFFESAMFRAHLYSISQELGYQFNTVFKLEANVTAESLEEILQDKDPEFDKAHGVNIPITVSSPAAMVELRSYLKSKSMMSSASAISDHLSTICDDKITVEVSQDGTYLNQALKDLDACRSSSDKASETTHIHKIKTNMAHQSQLENRKCRNWVKAGLGLKYSKEGLEPFCDQLVKQLHVDILSKVRQKHNLSVVSCGNCDIKTLQPDHVRTRSKQCPLGQINCNCQQPEGKTSCSVCGAIYDEIIKLHASASPYWKNTDAKHWCTEPWAVAKCFINATGYYRKLKASEFDCSGLLHVLKNNMDFRDHLNCTTGGTDLLQTVTFSFNNLNSIDIDGVLCQFYLLATQILEHRNMIYHSHNMELEDEDMTTYIDDMIALLQDDKELITMDYSKAAVDTLKELKHEDFLLPTTNKADIRKAVMADMKEAEQVKRDLEKTGEDVKKDVLDTAARGKADLIRTWNELKDEILRKITKWETMEEEEKRDDFDLKKARFQKKLVESYIQYALKVPALPLQPETNQTDIGKLYVSPWMTVEEWDKNSKQTKETEVSLDEIFSKKENPSKYIYILGEAGSGKSALCKCLVYYWCVAHSESTATTTKSEAVKEMENYDFLFHISLRHLSDLSKIEVMLEEIYPDPILSTILRTESDKCLILLDGLDEWMPHKHRISQFLTKGLPDRDLHAKYTIITTTRRWKFDSLKIPSSEMHKKIKLKGITGIAIKELTKTTVRILNETFHKDKVAENFEADLQRSPVADVSNNPMILQQLICLWFDGRLHGTSKCSVYSSMLDLFFDWKALRHPGSQGQTTSGLETDLRLPEYLCNYEACNDNASVIYHIARLAYKTLLTRYTDDKLIFSNSIFQKLKIPDDVKICSLNAGILSKDLNISAFASKRQHLSFSFVHKSMQEYLAAVHIAIKFEEMINSSDVSRSGSDNFKENCKKCIFIYFRNCKTAVDILEQSNVFIMLCGLEPKLLPYITEHIFSVIKTDKHMIKERNNVLDARTRSILNVPFIGVLRVLKANIQKCILSCINEASLEENFPKNSINIADIVPSGELMRYLHRHIFNLHSVVCLDIDSLSNYTIREQEIKGMTTALTRLTDIKCLKAFRFNIPYSLSEQEGEQLVQVISRNKTTLECVSLISIPAQTVRTLVQILPAVSHLISIQIDVLWPNVTVSHEINTSLCTYLEQSVHLQKIGLNIECAKKDEHSINLAQHQQLQLLDIEFSSMRVTGLNTNSLHTFKVYVSSSVMITQLCHSLYNARKLECLSLRVKPVHNAADARSDTENLTRLLPSLTSLVHVELEMFTVTDNIIKSPWDMKSIKVIRLRDVGMSMTTWYTFVDNISTLPRFEEFRLVRMHIIDTTRSNWYLNENVESKIKVRSYVTEKFESPDCGFINFECLDISN